MAFGLRNLVIVFVSYLLEIEGVLCAENEGFVCWKDGWTQRRQIQDQGLWGRGRIALCPTEDRNDAYAGI